jgi:hypothetical protein
LRLGFDSKPISSVKWVDGALQRVRSRSAQLVSPCTLGICHCK